MQRTGSGFWPVRTGKKAKTPAPNWRVTAGPSWEFPMLLFKKAGAQPSNPSQPVKTKFSDFSSANPE
jgi:hypothetical protein